MFMQLSLFLLLPVAASCGWYVGRKDHQRSATSPKMREDYFKGLNYLINEQPDKAVDVFIKLLEVDSDTVETHLALGNLFRRRGEVDRAIRVHQNLIARPELEKQYKVQALSALGQDYLHAGVLDRAERLFLELVDLGQENETSLRFLLHIYQQEKDWINAIEIARKLVTVSEESMHVAIAQYYCELAQQMQEQGQMNMVRQYLKRALITDRNCVRASLILAKIETELGHYKEAIRYYKHVKDQDSDFISEIVEPISACYYQLDEGAKLVVYLRECLSQHPRIALVIAITQYLQQDQGDKTAIEFLAQEVQCQPSLRGLSYLVKLYLANASGDTKEKLSILQKFIGELLDEKPIYRCEHCGYAGKTLFWLCPGCHRWSSVKPIQGIEGN